MDKVMKERDTTAFEVLSFDEMDRGSDSPNWLYRTLLGYIPEDILDDVVNAPDWNPKEMRIQITLNDRIITSATFNDIVNEFANRMLETKIQMEGLDSMQAAVAKKANSMLSAMHDGFTDAVFRMQENLKHLADQSEYLVEKAWSQPYKKAVTEEMLEAARKTLLEQFPELADLPVREVDQKAIKLYHAMLDAKPESMADKIKVVLPDTGISMLDLMGIDNLTDMQDQVNELMQNHTKAIADALDRVGVSYEFERVQE